VQIKIAVRHGHLNDETQQRIREKAQKLTHLFDRLTMIEVTVDLNHRDEHKDQKQVEFVVQAEHKHDFVARESHPDLLAAVDLAVEKVVAQLRRYKEKIQNHHRGRPPGGRTAPAEETAEE
jgi:putative sigma-54 modulation protein